MSTITTAPLRAARATGSRRILVLAALAVVAALVLALLLRTLVPPSPALVLGGGVTCLAVASLVFIRYQAAVMLGLVLLAIVRFQPAPTDAVFALVMAVAVLSGRFQVVRVPSIMLGLIAAFLALNVISAAGSASLGVAAGFGAITGYLMLFAVWLTSHLDGRPHARQVVVGYLVAALLSAALGVLAVLAPIPGRASLLFDGRAMALFKDPNVFGPFLVPALLILLEETISPRLLHVRRASKIAGVVLLGLGLLFSYSRGAWLNLAVGVMVMISIVLLRRRSARTTTRLLSLLIATIVCGTGAIVLTGSAAFLQERAHIQAYDTSRFAAQSAGIVLGERHPLGIGPGQFDVIEPLSSHNVYVRVFAEQGPLGLLVLSALVLGTLSFAIRNALHGRDTYGIGSAALLGAWGGLLVNGAVIDTLHWRHLWLVAALIWAGAMRTPGPAGSHRSSSSSLQMLSSGARLTRSRRPRA